MVGPQVLEITLRPRSEADRERLDRALAQLTAADPSFATCTGPSGQVILKGMGELHLDSKIDALKRIHKVDAAIGAPQVAYRETITRRVTVDYTHKKQTGGSGQFGRVKIVVEPNEPGAGYVFASKIVGGAVPDEYIPAVEHGLMRALGSGVIAGFSVVDLRVQLVDGAYHKVDSSVPAFEIAAEAALREAMQKGEPVLLEPIMKAEVTTPPEYAGAIIRDLKTRRATILDGFDVVTAFVPLANLFGYVNTLRSLSRGRATFTMRYDHYAPLPTTDNDPPFRPAAAMRLT